MKKFILFMMVLFIILPFSNCSKKKSTKPKKDETYVVKEETVVADDTMNENLATVNDDELVFSSSSKQLDKIEEGSVLIDGISDAAPFGYLRKVISKREVNGQIIIETEQASLNEVFEELDYEFNSDTAGTLEIYEMETIDGVALKKSTGTLLGFDVDFTKDVIRSGDDFINVSGSALLELSYNFGLSFSLLDGVTYFKTSVEVEQSNSLNVTVSTAYDGLNEDITLAKVTFNPWITWVGFIPLVFVPEVELKLSVDGYIYASSSAWFEESYHGELGMKYTDDDGVTAIIDSDFDIDYAPPSLDVNAGLKAAIGPEAKLKLYGVAGPFVNVLAYGDINFTADAQSSKTNYIDEYQIEFAKCIADASSQGITFSIGVQANAGVEIDILFTEFRKSVNLFDEVLFEFNSSNDGNLVKITNPSDESEYVVGESINIVAFTSGETPTDVEFYINDEKVFTDDSKPFEYKWLTEDESTGNYEIYAKANFPSETLTSDEVSIDLVIAEWQEIDLTNTLSMLDDIFSVSFLNNNDGVMVGGYMDEMKQLIFTTHDGGDTWTKTLDREPTNSSEICIKDIMYGANSIMAVGGSNIFTSVDGGNSWNIDTIYNDMEDIELNSDGNIMIMNKGSVTKYYHSAESGLVDILLPEVEDITLWYTNRARMSFTDDGVGYAVGSNTYESWDSDPGRPLIYKTTDNGTTWEILPVNIGNGKMIESIDFPSPETGYICGWNYDESGSFIMKSTDGGASWHNISPSGSWDTYMNDVEFKDEQTGYAISEWVIYYTNDGGENWTAYNPQNYYITLRDIFVLDKYHVWSVGSGGYIYRRSAG